MMKKLLPILIVFAFPTSAQAITWGEFWEPFDGHHHHHHPSRRRYYDTHNEVCTKKVYKERYKPGDIHYPGYVQRWYETYRVPCY